MATTSSVQVTSGAIGGQFNLRAKLAAGIVALGCAAALAVGGLRAIGTTPDQHRAAPQAAPQAVVAPVGAPRDCAQAVVPGPCGDFSAGSTPAIQEPIGSAGEHLYLEP